MSTLATPTGIGWPPSARAAGGVKRISPTRMDERSRIMKISSIMNPGTPTASQPGSPREGSAASFLE